jgi:hypothetical protein
MGMPAILWNDSERANAQELIEWLLSQMQDSGWEWNWTNNVAFAELASSASDPGLNATTAMPVFGEMQGEGCGRVEDFEAIFVRQQARRVAHLNQSKVRWRFFVPMNVTPSPALPRRARIRILGENFTFLLPESVAHQLKREDKKVLASAALLGMKTHTAVESVPEVFLAVSRTAAAMETAWQDVEPAFDALRGMLVLLRHYREARIFSSLPKPRSAIPHPLWMIATRPGAPAQWVGLIAEAGGQDTAFELTAQWFQTLRKNSRFLRERPERTSILSLIADGLRLYSQAMDARFGYQCLLGFWQLAEAITRVEARGGKTKTVVERLARHGTELGLKGSGFRYTLDSISDKRNEIVHHGILDVGRQDVNVLKLACEAALSWLIVQRDYLPTLMHLDKYYELRDIGASQLTALKECIAYIEAIRA